jgi:hypothetical protein
MGLHSNHAQWGEIPHLDFTALVIMNMAEV